MADEAVFQVYAKPYNFMDWYWLADDGRLWSSKKRALVQDTDPDYVAWSVDGWATVWPSDDQGNQTDAALQAIFDSYDIEVGGVPIADLPAPQQFVVKSGK